jgi:hypothetical protein
MTSPDIDRLFADMLSMCGHGPSSECRRCNAEKALRALAEVALARAAPPAPREPVWTTTACPHCGGEVDGIRVLTEAEIGRAPPAGDKK